VDTAALFQECPVSFRRIFPRLWLWGTCLLIPFACIGCWGVCEDYSCVNVASMTGSVEVPSETTAIDVEYCSKRACTAGVIEVSELMQTACNTGFPGPHDDGVCATRTTTEKLEVEAALTRPDNRKRLPDETYTLKIIDHDSEEVLLDVTRKADYVTYMEDECHLCSAAEMRF